MFFDPADFPALAPLKAHWRDIRAEYDALAAQSILWPCPSSHNGLWRFIPLRMFDDRTTFTRLTPITAALCDAIPNCQQYQFSIMEPGCEIKPHEDDINFVRSHLVLHSDPEADCAIEVGGVVRPWREGELTLFDERIMHSTWNRGTKPRVTLMFGFDLDPSVNIGSFARDFYHEVLERVAELELTKKA